MPERKNFPFKIGADPEFNIMLQDKRIKAMELMIKLFEYKYSIVDEMGYKIGTAGNIGWDGANATGELRPEPSNNPSKVIENLHELLQAFVKETKLFSLSTTSEKAPVGGHIHLELSQELAVDSRKINQIQKQIASFYLPLMMGEDMINLKIRFKNEYGKIMQFRTQRLTESVTTFEFRVPSAEWLTTPKVALGTLAYVATVYNEILNHPETIKKNSDIIFTNYNQGEALQMLAISKYQTLTKMIINKVKKRIKEFEFYPEFKEEIEFILNPTKVMDEKKKCHFNIIEGWHLNEIKEPTKRMILSQRQVDKKAQENNIDYLINLFKVYFNPDANVELYAKSLKERMILMNWQLKKNYFIFGLKKGINDFLAYDMDYKVLYGREQINTINDWECLNTTMNKMKSKLVGLSGLNLIQCKMRNQIFIGIPYKIRIDKSMKEFLNLVYEIEKEKYPAKEVTGLAMSSDQMNNKNSKWPGEIYEIYQKNSLEDSIENGGIIAPERSEHTVRREEVMSEMAEDGEQPNETESERSIRRATASLHNF